MYEPKYKLYKKRYFEIKNKIMLGGGEHAVRTPIDIKGSVKTLRLSKNEKSGGPEREFPEVGGAGVLPYDIVDDKIYFLLGYDPHWFQKQWKVFGGGKDKVDHNQRETAYREALEEACDGQTFKTCLLPLRSVIKKELSKGTPVLCIPVQHTKTGKWTNFYFVRIDRKQWIKENGSDDITLPEHFILRNEVNHIRWFTEKEIVNEEVGKIHEPILIIFREHRNELNKMLRSLGRT